MRVRTFDSVARRLVLVSDTSMIKVSPKIGPIGHTGLWDVEWRRSFTERLEEDGYSAQGINCWNPTELLAAFDLPYEMLVGIRQDDELLNQFGGTVARSGMFIRFEKCLNIPGPAVTIHSASVSLIITPEIQECVRQMLFAK